MKGRMPMMNSKMIVSILLLLTSFYSCYYDKAEELYPNTAINCDTATVTYAAVIKPIIDKNCATSGCHSDAYANGYDLSYYAGLEAVANNGKLIESIEQTGASPMPQGAPKLDACTIEQIKKWVNDGAPNN